MINFFYLNLKLRCMRKMLTNVRGQQHYLRPKRNDLRAVFGLRQDLKLAAESGTAHSSFNNFCDCARQHPQLLSSISCRAYTYSKSLRSSSIVVPSSVDASGVPFLSQCQPRKELMSVPNPGRHLFPAIVNGLSRRFPPRQALTML